MGMHEVNPYDITHHTMLEWRASSALMTSWPVWLLALTLTLSADEAGMQLMGTDDTQEIPPPWAIEMVTGEEPLKKCMLHCVIG